MFSKFKKLFFAEVLAVFLLSLTPLFWFHGNEVVLGHDSGFRLLSIPYLKSLYYSWNPTVGFGIDWGINKGFLVTQLPEVLGTYLSGSLSVAQRFSFILWFFAMAISMYVFVRSFFPEKKFWIFRLFSSIFYSYNFFILQAWFIGERAKFSLYASLPLALLIIIKTIKGKYSVLKGAILFSLLFFFLNGGGSPPLYGSIFLVSFLAFLFFSLTSLYKKGTKALLRPFLTVILFVLGFLTLNAYWLFPQAYLFFNIYGPELASVGGISGALVWEGIVNRFSSFVNLFRLQGIPDWYSDPHPFSKPFIENPVLIVASFIPILTILLGLWHYFPAEKEERKRREIVLFVLVLFIVGLIFTAGSHPPFGFIYVFLIKYLPGFAIFRTAFYKFAPGTWFPAAFLTGFFLNFLILKFIENGKKYVIAGIISLALILGYHYPYFSDKLFDWNLPFSTKVEVPGYVTTMSEYISSLDSEYAKILLIPPMDPHFNSDNYIWGYWSLDLLPRISTTKPFLANDTNREKLVDAMYSAIERRDENDFIYFAKLAGVNRVLWRNDILYNNKITKSDDASFWEKNLKSFQGVSLEKEVGEWRLYSLDSTLYPTPLFANPQMFSYIESDQSPTEETYKALSKNMATHLLYSVSSAGKNLDKILEYSNSFGIEAACVYCKPGEYMKFVDDLSLPYTNFLPGSLFYSIVEKRELKALKEFENFPHQRIDTNLGISNKRLGEAALLIGRAGSQDIYGRERTSQLITTNLERYRENIEDSISQLTKLNLLDKNTYSLKILGYLSMHKRSISAVENQYNLAPNAFEELYGFINERIVQLEKDVWVTKEETSKKYLVTIAEPGFYNLTITGHRENPISIILDGETVSSSEVFLDTGVYRLELVYKEPKNLLEESPGELIDIVKGESRRLKIDDYLYTDSYAVSFDFLASENTRPSLIIFQDNDKPNILGKTDSIKYDLKTSRVLRPFSFVFDPKFLAKEAFLGFEYQGFNSFRDEEYFDVLNPRVYRTYSPKVFFVKEREEKRLGTPDITTQFISPTEYRIKVTDAESVFILNFTQAYNNGWKAFIVENGTKESYLTKLLPRKFFSQIDPTLHFSLDGYSNAWLIDKNGDFEVMIFYGPQSFFYIGLLITIFSLSGSLILLFFLKKDNYVTKN